VPGLLDQKKRTAETPRGRGRNFESEAFLQPVFLRFNAYFLPALFPNFYNKIKNLDNKVDTR
jgi:hypothetical protein